MAKGFFSNVLPILLHTSFKKLNIQGVKDEYRILHFACDKNGKILHYNSRNNFNSIKKHGKGLFFTQAMKMSPFSILASFQAIQPTVRRGASVSWVDGHVADGIRPSHYERGDVDT